MKQERINGIIIFGWFLVALSFLYTIAIPKIISLHYELVSLSAGLPENINFLPKLTIYPAITTSVVFLFFLVTGIGILKLKRWAYYFALLIPFIYGIGITKNVWILGPQSIMGLSSLSALAISLIILLFLMKKDIIEHFKADYITKRGKKINPKKVIFRLLIIVVSVNIISSVFWLLFVNFVNIEYRDKLPIINLKPQKIEYRIQDKSFILNNCEKRDVFDYSIYIPKDWKVGNISMGDSGLGWNLSFLNMENSNLKAFIMLDSKGLYSSLLPISKVLNFNTVYDFEKTVNYPNWTPIFLILKTIGSPKNLESIDEATASTWRGFVKVIKSKERNFYDGSLYSLEGNKTCSIAVLSKNGVITSEQAKSIIASLEFKSADAKSESLFEKGKNDLANADFTSAAISFMNALYINERNPEYAYYLARSLFEDSSVAGRKSRIGASKKFLEYTLKLNPSYQKAKELLVSVDSEIKHGKQGKKDD